MKFKNLIFPTIIFIFLSNICLAQNDVSTYSYWKTSLGYSVDLNKLKLSNIPETIRAVPIHPNDTYALSSNWEPIRDLSFSRKPSFLLFNLSAGKGLNYQRLLLEAEVFFDIDFADHYSDKILRNYTNSPGTAMRGYGAALTYYRFEFSSFNYGGSIRFGYSLSDFNVIFLKYRANLNRISINTGWDRYNSFETYKDYKVGLMLNHIIDLGWEILPIDGLSIILFGSLEFPKIKTKPIGEGIQLDAKNFFSFGITISGLSSDK